MYKQGQELEDAGMYEQASRAYMDALRRDGDNIEALVALQNAARIVVDNKYADFFQAVQAGDDRTAIQAYKDAEAFRAELQQYNIDIPRPTGHEEDFQLALERYLNYKYQEGRSALGASDFNKAESIFMEISALNPTYRDVPDLLRLSQARPVYDEAVALFDARKYRQAYRLFDRIEASHGPFEQSGEYKTKALRNGQYGLGLMAFENHTNQSGVESVISSQVIKLLQDKNDPFLKLIDRSMIDRVTEEQVRAMSGQSDPTSVAEAGKLVGAKAILVGELVSMSVDEGEVKRMRRPGYLARQVTRRNREGERVTTTVYDKVWYYDIEQSSTVSIIFQFKMIDVETGEILITDAVNLSSSDEIAYSEYGGEGRNLYMGEWTNMNESRSTDRVLKDRSSKRRLDARLSARHDLKPIEELKTTLFSQISSRVAESVYQSYMNTEN